MQSSDGDLFAPMDQNLPEGDLFMKIRELLPKQQMTPMHLLASSAATVSDGSDNQYQGGPELEDRTLALKLFAGKPSRRPCTGPWKTPEPTRGCRRSCWRK